MGSGKTTVGRMLAEKLNRPFIDTDEEIEKTTNRSIAEIFKDPGETEFRKLEKELIRNIAAVQTPSVIALGGGSLMDAGSLDVVKSSGLLIYLECSIDVLRRRLQNSLRPLLKTESMESLIEKRLPGYVKADRVFSSQSGKAENIAREIHDYLNKLHSER